MTITTPEVWDSYQDSGEDVLTGGNSALPDVAGSTPAWGHTQGRCVTINAVKQWLVDEERRLVERLSDGVPIERSSLEGSILTIRKLQKYMGMR